MRVRIVCYEEVHAWILGKFALRLNDELIKLGIKSDIAKVSDPEADINHHIIYMDYVEKTGSSKDTLMITHINDIRKLNQLKRQLEIASMGVCMSKEQMDKLILGGLAAEKLCYINPAHDGVVPFKPYIIGITSKVQPDGCKRESMLVELSSHISPKLFAFKIMGAGWEEVIAVLRKKGFQVIYYPEFDYKEYVKLIPSLDYYLYLGQDEGSMGFVDALAAGVKTIVTPQGFHLDAEKGITHSFNTIQELVKIFSDISNEKQTLLDAVSTWTWKDYAVKHLEVWQYLLKKNGITSLYRDGLNSLTNKTSSYINEPIREGRLTYLMYLYKGAWSRTYYKIKKGFSDYETFKRKSRSFVKNLMK